MRMFNPPHPGEILADLWLEPNSNCSVIECFAQSCFPVGQRQDRCQPGNGSALGNRVRTKCGVLAGFSSCL